MPISGDTFKFFRSQIVGKRSGIPKSISIQDHWTKRSTAMFFKERRTGLKPLDQQADDIEARDDFWSMSGKHIYRHHERKILCA